MKPLSVLLPLLVSLCSISYARDEHVRDSVLSPPKFRRDSNTIFEGSPPKNRAIARDEVLLALNLNNLPHSQMDFRIKALEAVSNDVNAGASASLMAYSTDDVSQFGWKRLVIPRKQTLFGEAVSVVLLKLNDQTKSVDLAVRGTVNLEDVLQDLKAQAVFDEDLGFRVHSGFRALSQEILERLRKELSDDVFNTYSFRLYGHSMGGSIASILSMYLHQKGTKVDVVVTFGAPRFTTNEGTRKYQVLNQVTHRIVRCDDVVPFMPPPNFFGWSNESYQANGNIFLILRPPFFDLSIGIDIERDFTYQLRLELENKGATRILAYGHRMENYLSRLNELAPPGSPDETKHGGVSYHRDDLRPVSYRLAFQSKLCPAQVAATP